MAQLGSEAQRGWRAAPLSPLRPWGPGVAVAEPAATEREGARDLGD